jgi:serine/threonine protein kinase/Tfp pilus assembly protein PilF
MINRTLGHYRVLEQIGAGGMGVVYRAQDAHLDRDVALKVLPPDTFHDDGARRRFRKEALALSRLNHPNIATVHDFDTDGDVDFLVVELISGTSMDDLLRSGPLPEKEVIRLGQQLAEGIAAAHEEGVLHRDLKPGNLRITRDGWLKILDFGLAKATLPADATTELKQSVGTAGTLPYMAPEQLSRGHADQRTDVWAIGVVLYEMATGKRPFDYPTAPRVASAILTETPPAPTSLNRDVSSGLQQIILKCLEKEPENRYHSAREISVDLRRTAGTTTAAIPATRRAARWNPRTVWAMVAVAAAVGLFAVRPWKRDRHPGGDSPRIESLAVLPLTNLSGQPEQEYFSDGMTDALITELAQIQELTVISRTSVLPYKNARKPMSQIGRELKVDAVVEGSVQRAGDRVAINVQLIHAPEDRHLWAKNYDGNLRDVLGLQREMARAIAAEIKAKLTPQQEAHFAGRRPVDPVVYDAVLKGFHHARQVTEEGLEKGLKYFREALQRDPNYAPAHLGVCYVYAWMGEWYAPNREVFPKAKDAALKAIELDPSLAEAHAYLATLFAAADHDWTAADREFRLAIQLNPGSADTRRWYGSYLTGQGQFEAGLQELRRAVEIDPLSAETNTLLGHHFFFARRYDESIEQLRRTLELDPRFFFAEIMLGEAYAKKEMFAEAVAAYHRAEKAAAQGGEVIPDILGGLAYINVLAGNRGEATKYLKELEDLSKRRYVAPFEFAKVFLVLGRTDESVAWLEKAYQDRNWPMIWIKVDPRFDALRSEPRFQSILQRMNFPD